MGGCLSHLLSAGRKSAKPVTLKPLLQPLNEEIQCFREENVRTPRLTANRRY
jgi:hypothetical protein